MLVNDATDAACQIVPLRTLVTGSEWQCLSIVYEADGRGSLAFIIPFANFQLAATGEDDGG